MAYLTNDPSAIRRATGFDPLEHSLPPKLAVDGYRAAMPLMAVDEGPLPLIFMKEIDRTNVEHLRHQGVRFVWYAPYFTFGGLREPSDAYPNLASAVRSELRAGATVDPSMTMDLFRELEDVVGAGADPTERFHVPRNHYVVVPRDVEAAFAWGRRELTEAAAPLIADLRTDRLEEWLGREPVDRFVVLDRLMEEAGLDVLLAASPLAIQDLTGIPMRSVGDGAWAVYPRGSQVVHLLARCELPLPDLPLAPKSDAGSVRELASGGRIGFEEVAVSFEVWTGFGLGELETAPATSVLRRWRELRSWEDVAAYVIGARVTLEAIGSALTLVERELTDGRRVTELDAYQRYRSKVGSFLRLKEVPIRVRTYFTHTHAGNRSHFPASATDHEVAVGSSLKIDGGLEIYDSRGMFLGVSDITRSAVGTAQAKDFYELLDRALVEGVIAACRPGVKGADVFGAGLAFLEPHRADIIGGGFLPPSDSRLRDLFTRNIGHLIGKQEPATVEFRSSDQGWLERGMVAAAEFQWPYAEYCIGVEDIFLVTEDGPVNLTRPAS